MPDYMQVIFTRVSGCADWQQRGVFWNAADAYLALRNNIKGLRAEVYGAKAEGVMVTFCPDGGAVVDTPAGCASAPA